MPDRAVESIKTFPNVQPRLRAQAALSSGRAARNEFLYQVSILMLKPEGKALVFAVIWLFYGYNHALN